MRGLKVNKTLTSQTGYPLGQLQLEDKLNHMERVGPMCERPSKLIAYPIQAGSAVLTYHQLNGKEILHLGQVHTMWSLLH